MSSIHRFDPVQKFDTGGQTYGFMEPAEDGDYVMFRDMKETLAERDALSENQKWYSTALGTMAPLRWHVNELVTVCESANRFARAMGRPPAVPTNVIDAAKAANEKVNRFFAPDGA